jgi:glutamine synthetase
VKPRLSSVAEVMRLVEEKGVQMIDLKFCDVPGTWQHFTVPLEEFDESLFTKGTGFDGSSIRGFQQIQESDMLVVADAVTAVIDPVFEVPTLSLIGDVWDPHGAGSNQPARYPRDPRYISHKAEEFLRTSGIGDVSYWGPELEFFIFDSVRFDQNAQSGYYFVDSDEGAWNSGSEANLVGDLNLGYRLRHKEGYFPTPPSDTFQDLRTEISMQLREYGIHVEKHHHEVATAGQAEIDMRYDSLVRMADNVMSYKYVVKNVARSYGKVATFMPKPIFGDNGSGMHTHQSIWKGGQNLFSDPAGYAGISDLGLYYIGGLLRHAPALLAFCAPTTNSYKRLVPGFEAPVNLAYSQRNRSACARIPMYFDDPKSKRVEFRVPDPTCNPYLAFAAMLMAGLDGIINKIHPGKPMEKDLYDLPPREAARIKQTPGSLEEVLAALKRDHEFLLRGGVFTQDLIDTWLDYKQTRELDPMHQRPHPYEFVLYFDA